MAAGSYIVIVVVGTVFRGRFRKHFSIDGRWYWDLLCYLFCFPCAICQEWRHVLTYGTAPFLATEEIDVTSNVVVDGAITDL